MAISLTPAPQHAPGSSAAQSADSSGKDGALVAAVGNEANDGNQPDQPQKPAQDRRPSFGTYDAAAAETCELRAKRITPKAAEDKTPAVASAMAAWQPLVEMGFAADSAKAALQLCDGDIRRAAEALIAGTLAAASSVHG